MGNHDLRDRTGDGAGEVRGGGFPPFAGASLFHDHLLPRLRGQRRRVQGDGARPLWRAAVRGRGADPGLVGSGGTVRARSLLLRFRARPADVLAGAVRPVRRPATAAWSRDRTTPQGRRPQPPGGPGGDPPGEGPLAARPDRALRSLHGRRSGPQCGGQWADPAGGAFRAALRAAGGRRLGRLPRRRRSRLDRTDRRAARDRTAAAGLSGSPLAGGRDRRPPRRHRSSRAGLPRPGDRTFSKPW